MLSISARYQYDGMVDYWSGNGRRWDDDAGCLFAYLHRGITCLQVIDQLANDYADTCDFDHPIWQSVSSEGIRKTLLSMVQDPEDLDRPLEGYEDLQEDENTESPVFVVLIEIDDDDVEEHNADLLSEWFRQSEEWILEYVQSDDYAGEYGYLMCESDRINQSVQRLLRDYEIPESVDRDQLADDVASRILNEGLYDHHVVDEYSSESCGYLDSFQIGEYEDQIDVDRIRKDLDDKICGEFLDVLEDWIESQRDHCLRSWGDLRESKYPTVLLITYTGLRIDYVIDEDQLGEILSDILGEGGAE